MKSKQRIISDERCDLFTTVFHWLMDQLIDSRAIDLYSRPRIVLDASAPSHTTSIPSST